MSDDSSDNFRSTLAVAEEFGEPDEIEETIVPNGSAWGMQDGFKHKIQAGERVLQWLYYGQPQDRCFWFAMVGGEWILTLSLLFPSGMARKNRC